MSASKKSRAEINRENAQKSTGPKTEAGKQASSRNAFKHSLYSERLIVPGEDPAEFDELRATLRHEHQPVNSTEELLVDELAQHYWRMRRIREQETNLWRKGFTSSPIPKQLDFYARAATSAERSFHRTLAALLKLQKLRGFVPLKTKAYNEVSSQPGSQPVPESQVAAAAAGFVPLKTQAVSAVTIDPITAALEAIFPPDNAPQKKTSGFVPKDMDDLLQHLSKIAS